MGVYALVVFHEKKKNFFTIAHISVLAMFASPFRESAWLCLVKAASVLSDINRRSPITLKLI